MNKPSPFKTSQEIEIKDFKNDDIKKIDDINQWHICCCERTTDARFLKFMALYIIIFIVFIFDLFMLWKSKTCSQETTYMSLLTFLIGLIIPSH